MSNQTSLGLTVTSRIILASLFIIISGCTTTSTSFTTPYSTTTSSSSTPDNYDRKKAAATRLSLGMRYLAQGDYDKAKFNLDKAFEHDPNGSDVLRGYAWYYEKVSENELAETYYKKAIKIDAKSPDLLNQYGVFLCRKGKLAESLQLFSQSAQILSNKNVSGTFENAATCSYQSGDIEQAQRFYRRALNHNPEQRDSLLGMARIEFGKARYERTRSYLKRYERVSSHTPRSLWLALRTESHLKNMNGVASYAIKLEQLFPDSEETATYLDTKRKWLH